MDVRDMLTIEDLTESIADHVKAIAPELHVERDGSDRVRIDTDGDHFYIGVHEAYDRYIDDPDKQDEIVTDAAERLLVMLHEKDEKPTSADIVPVIRDRPWLEMLRADARASGVDDIDLVADDLNDELVVVYAFDLPSSIRFVGESELESFEVMRADLRDLAIKNLYRLVPTIGSQEFGGVLLLTAGGIYESSLLLLDYLWTDFLPIDGSAVVAVPNRDVLLVAGENEEAGVERLREFARRSFEDEEYPIVPHLFARRDGRWVRF